MAIELSRPLNPRDPHHPGAGLDLVEDGLGGAVLLHLLQLLVRLDGNADMLRDGLQQ